MIKQADLNEIDTVCMLVQRTIENIYPHYYPRGAINFFLRYHCREAVERDVFRKMVYILWDENNVPVGTVTINGKEFERLFVPPAFQRKGYGSQLIKFAEDKIFERHDEIIISSSFPAKAIYIAKGYREAGYHTLLTDNGDVLCYDDMRKTKESF